MEDRIVLLAECSINLSERFTPIIAEIRKYLPNSSIICIFARFEIEDIAFNLPDGVERFFFPKDEIKATSIIKSLPHTTLITLINHNATIRDYRLFRAAQKSKSPKTIYLLRNCVSLNEYFIDGIDNSRKIRCLVKTARITDISIHLKVNLLVIFVATVMLVAKPIKYIAGIKKQQKKRILFIKLDVLGDMIVTIPYLRALRQAYKDAELTVLASKRGAVILEEQGKLYEDGLFDELLIWDTPWHFKCQKLLTMHDLWKTVKALPGFWRKRYQLVIQPVGLGTGVMFALLTLGERIVAIIDPYLPLARRMRHFVTDPIDIKIEKIYHLKDFTELALAYLGVSRDDTFPSLLVSDDAQNTVSQFLGQEALEGTCEKLIVVNVGAGNALRVWGADKFAALIRSIVSAYRATVVLVGSNADAEMAAEIKCLSAVPVVNSVGRLSLNDIIALAKRADLMVTVDTGIMHLAAALETPMVAIYGAGLVDFCKPLSTNYIIVKKELGCSGCADRCFVEGRPPCLDAVDVDDVFSAVQTILDRK